MKKKDVKDIPCYTINTYDFTNEKVLGTLTANSTHTISLAREFFADVQALFGGKSPLIEKKIDDVVNSARTDFIKEVYNRYPNATSVIGLNIRLSDSYMVNDTLNYARSAYNIAKMFFGGEAQQPVYTLIIVAVITGTAVGKI